MSRVASSVLDATEGRITRGDAFPASPLEGDLHFDTTDEIWYYADTTRGRWLSVHLFERNFGHVSVWASSTYTFLPNGVQCSTSMGHHFGSDMRVVGIVGVLSAGANTHTISIFRGTSSIGTVSMNGSATTIEDLTLNLAFAANDILALYHTSGFGTPADPNFTIYLRIDGGAIA